MSWLTKPPYVPEKGHPSVFYWYYNPEKNEMWPTEVYAGCWKLYAYKGLWWSEPIKPPEKPQK